MCLIDGVERSELMSRSGFQARWDFNIHLPISYGTLQCQTKKNNNF